MAQSFGTAKGSSGKSEFDVERKDMSFNQSWDWSQVEGWEEGDETDWLADDDMRRQCQEVSKEEGNITLEECNMHLSQWCHLRR